MSLTALRDLLSRPWRLMTARGRYERRRNNSPRTALESLESRVLMSAMAISAAKTSDKTSGTNGAHYFRVGNPNDAVPSSSAIGQGGVALLGGGQDVDAAFLWMIDRMADTYQTPSATGGDFLVLRATQSDGYNPYIQAFGGTNSVATLNIPTRSAASNPEVAQIIGRAEAIFIAGGDQGDYIGLWTGTPVQAAIANRIAARVPVGGTSAGSDVLSQFVYSAEYNGVTSAEALANPFNKRITLAHDFVPTSLLPALENTIVDTHFQTRDRTGRMAAFLARVNTSETTVAGWPVFNARPRGIGLNEQTALLISPDGHAEVVGNTTAASPPGVDFFLTAETSTVVCEPRRALTYDALDVARVGVGGTFDLSDWEANWQHPGPNTTRYTVSIVDGVLTSTLPTAGTLLAASSITTSTPTGTSRLASLAGFGFSGDFAGPKSRDAWWNLSGLGF